jgi:serine/threonine protein phosphatase 1
MSGKRRLKNLEKMGRPKKKKGNRYVLGDVHANYRALKEVMKHFNNEEDELIVLGDVVDGYSQTFECVELLLKVKKLTFVLGNHDQFFLDWFTKGVEPYIWLSQGGTNTIYSYKCRGYEGPRIPQEHKDFFLKAVPFHEVDKMLFVHGGFKYPDHPVNNTKEFLMWDRTLIDRFASKLQVKEWNKIFIGHTSTEREGEKPIRYEVPGFATLIRVDCGAGWKGKLCLYNIDTDEYFLSEHCIGSR